MAEKRVSVRIAAVGGQELKAQMHAIGVEGRQALTGITSAAAPASAGMQNVDGSASAALGAMEQLSARSTQAAAAMRSAAASVTPLQSQINRLTGVTPAIGQTTSSFLQQGQAIDDIRAKFNPMFGVIRQYRDTLGEIRNAHYQGAISADEMANAISRERREALASIATLKARNTAVMGMASATRLASNRMQQMSFQLNDIGVSLAGGMNPFLVMAQQGTQIAQIYGFGQGGVGQALKDVGGLLRGIVTRFPLVTAAVVAGTAAIAGMTKEINETTEETVNFGDVAKAVFQVLGDRIMDKLRPAIEAIAPWFDKAWDAIVVGVKWVGNAIINGITVAINYVRTHINTLPDMFEAAFAMATSLALGQLQMLVYHAGQAINGIAEGLNAVFGSDLPTDNFSGAEKALHDAGADFYRQSVEAGKRVGNAWNDFSKGAKETMQRDPMGDFFGDVRKQAIENARKRKEEDEDDSGGSKSKKKEKDAADDLIKSLQKELAVLRETDPIKKKMIEYADKLKDATAAQRARVLELVTTLDRAKNGWEAVGRSLAEYAESAKRIGDDMGKTFVGAFKSAEDAVAEFVKTGKFNIKDMVLSMIADFARLSVRKNILGPLAGALGNALGGGAGGVVSASTVATTVGNLRTMASYDGGGHTGYAPRTGGLDGKGGFLAMLHPRERVHDEYRSGSSAGAPQQHNSFSISIQGTGREEIMRGVEMAIRTAQAEADRQLPDKIQRFNRDPSYRPS